MTQATSHRGMRFHLLCSKPIKPMEAAKVARALADLDLITPYGPIVRYRILHPDLSATLPLG